MLNAGQQPLIVFEDPRSPIKVEQQPRTIRTYSVTDQELDLISSPSGSLHLTLAGITFGAFSTCLLTLITVNIPNAHIFATFIAATIATLALSIFFGVNGIKEIRKAKTGLGKIRSGS